MNMKKKLGNKKGFTLAETLLALLILLLVSIIVATGIPAARNAYEKVVMGSNAQVLLSTAVNELRGELGTATDVEIVEVKGQIGVSYISPATGVLTRIYTGTDPERDSVTNTILVTEYTEFVKDNEGKTAEGATKALVSAAASTKDMYVTFNNVTYEGGIVSFSGLEVRRTSNNDVLATLKKSEDGSVLPLEIRVLFADDDQQG